MVSKPKRTDLPGYDQRLKPLSGEIEMNETIFGGKRVGKRGWGTLGKIIVFQYRGINQVYFPLYLKEVEWQFNHRNENLVIILLRRLLNQQISIVKEQI